MAADPLERWHLKKEIQLSHLISTAAIAISAVIYIGKIEQRLSVVETQLIAQRESSSLLRAQLERMDAKLDRLIERDHK